METSKARGAPPLRRYAEAPWHDYKAQRALASLSAYVRPCRRVRGKASEARRVGGWGGEAEMRVTGCLHLGVRSFGSAQRGTIRNYPSVGGGLV